MDKRSFRDYLDKSSDPKLPGSRGGHGYRNSEGHWVYGDRPPEKGQSNVPFLENLIRQNVDGPIVVPQGESLKGYVRQAINKVERELIPHVQRGFTPKVLTHGKQALVIDLGDKVARIKRGKVQPRVQFSWMLQAIDKGETKAFGYEVVPKVRLVDKQRYSSDRSYSTKVNDDLLSLHQAAKESGYDFWDLHEDNIGYVGRVPVIIDPGAVRFGLPPSFFD